MSINYLRVTAILSALLVAACSSTGTGLSTAAPGSSVTTGDARVQLDQRARVAMETLYRTAPRAKELGDRAYAVLVFPDILKAGLLVGGSGGKGVLFSKDGTVLGYYEAGAVTYGLQAGAQNFSEAMFLMTPEAKHYLDRSDGWSVGMGPSVVVAQDGFAKEMTTTTEHSDIYAFVFAQSGLMAGLGLEGQKITKLTE